MQEMTGTLRDRDAEIARMKRQLGKGKGKASQYELVARGGTSAGSTHGADSAFDVDNESRLPSSEQEESDDEQSTHHAP